MSYDCELMHSVKI